MFQLIYLRFTQPRADATAFAVQTVADEDDAGQSDAPARTSRSREALNARALPEPSAPATARRRRRSTSGTSTSRWRSTRIGSPTPATSRSSSSAASTSPTMKPLVERYLGALPVDPPARRPGRTSACARRPASIEKTVEKGIEPKSQVAIVFTGPFEYDQTQRVAIRAMAEILQRAAARDHPRGAGRHLQHQRERRLHEDPDARIPITIDFGCDPKRTDDLIKRVLRGDREIQERRPDREAARRREGGAAQDFDSQHEAERATCCNQITLKYQYGEDPATLWDVLRRTTGTSTRRRSSRPRRRI